MSEKKIQIYGKLAGEKGADGKDGGYYKPSLMNDGTLMFVPSNSNMPPVGSVGNIKGKDGKDGKDGSNGSNGYTPQKGVDYFDGKDGVDGKSAYEYAQDGGYEGTETEFATKLASPYEFTFSVEIDEQGAGTADVNVQSLYNAFVSGTPVVCWAKFYGSDTFLRLPLLAMPEDGAFQFFANAGGEIAVVQVMVVDGAVIAYGMIMSNDITIGDTTWYGESIDFTDAVNQLITDKLPTALKNPKALTFTGAATGSYDGSSAKTVNIPNKTSQLTNDSGYITGYTETDPTVPAWAKASTKPTYTASEVGAAPSSHTHPYLPLSGGTMNDGSTIKLSSYGNRFLTISGNAINADMSNTTGGWAGTFAGVKDPAGDTTTMLGWYGGTSGLTHIFMGGTYSDPYMKMTKAGEFGFKNVPKVGTTNVALTTDIPTSLKNPNAITFTGAVTGTYDGSSAKTVNIPTQPTKTSQLTNDSNFITKAVSDLTNYYTKSNTYTKTEVNELVSAIPKFSISVVSALPTSNISNTTIYLVSGGEGSNLYTEYIYVNNKWEILGSQEVDLTGYAKTTDIPTSLKNPKALTFTGAATGSYDGSSAKTINIPTAPTKTSQLTNDSGYVVVAEVMAVEDQVKQKGVHYIVGNSTTAGVWTGTCDSITKYFDGLTIAYRTNVAGVSGGTTLNINNLGAVAIRRNVSEVTTHYGANSLLHLTYTTVDGVGYWQMADYDSNTKTTAGSSNKVGTKMYLVGGTSQSSSGVTTYTNKNVYIGTDNCLYSNGKKTMVIVDPQMYGAKGDGSTDDTTAFTNALANNRKVYVPGGTYKLTSGIAIRDNCELELAQDAVLNFTNTSGNCITLNMSSSLKGNHATINVPYEFSGNVIYADTTTTTNTSAPPPFTKWTPQSKSGRYVTDINICKADSRGFHYSVNGDTYGTAVYISADGETTQSHFMWGVHYSGLRIAGGFKYGIRAVNYNDGWNHEMRIDAFIEACEIGVSLENCKNAYISAAIQPTRAYSMSEVYSPYAKHGIELINSRNTDLSGSRVWDWNETCTLWTNGGEYQHIALKGNCSGLILNDFLYYEQPTIDIRDLIYTDTASNLEKLTILQEPFTRWFKPIEGEPYFYNGLDNKKILIEDDLDPYFQTDTVKNYTDVLATATDASGNIFNGIGYQRGVRFTSLGTGTDLTASNYYMVTGFIPVKPGTTIYTKDLRFNDTTESYAGIVYYNSSKTRFSNMGIGNVVNGNATYVTNYTETSDGCSFAIPTNATLTNNGLAYIRMVYPISGVGSNPSISLNQPISESVAGFLADDVKVKAENIVGLQQIIAELVKEL